MSQYDYNFFEYFANLERKLKVAPLNLGGIIGSGGGGGAPPGGFIGMLPQTRVTYDLSENALSGFISANPYDASGVLISASLLDNLNHIRYRLEVLEGGGGSTGVDIYNEDVLVLSNITVLDFHGAESVTYIGGGEVEVDVSKSYLTLTDTPNTYTGEGNKIASVKGDESGMEFITISGGVDTFKAKISSDDTTEDFLESKIIAGSNITVTVLNDGAYETLEVAASGVQLINKFVITIGLSGDITEGVGRVRMLAPYDGVISGIYSTIYTVSVSGNLIADINKNGATIFTNQANRVTILEGENNDLARIPDVTSFNINDVFTMDRDSVPSGVTDLVVQIRCYEV